MSHLQRFHTLSPFPFDIYNDYTSGTGGERRGEPKPGFPPTVTYGIGTGPCAKARWRVWKNQCQTRYCATRKCVIARCTIKVANTVLLDVPSFHAIATFSFTKGVIGR